MTAKNVALALDVRDAEGVIMATHNAQGVTSDEGLTVVIPLGYLPPIEETPIADLHMTLIPPPEPKAPTALVSRVNDYEAGTSTLTFAYE
jgi:hypothetical protein